MTSLALCILSLASIFLALKTSNEPILPVFENTWAEPLFQKFTTGNTIIFDLSIGFLISVIFYIIVVYLPERKRKNLIKNNYRKQYKLFKEDTIYIFLSACGEPHHIGLAEKLNSYKEFREFFNEKVIDSQTR
jgi:hypothetical protein